MLGMTLGFADTDSHVQVGEAETGLFAGSHVGSLTTPSTMQPALKSSQSKDPAAFAQDLAALAISLSRSLPRALTHNPSEG